MWIVTSAFNDYNQYGDYFVAAYESKPTLGELKKILPTKSDETLNHILSGGGRERTEDEWFHLIEVKHGEKSTAQG